MRRAVLASALTLSLAGSTGLMAHTAEAVTMAAPGAIGHDISHPQCTAGTDLPAGGAFAIVGVTSGRAFDPANECLAEYYAWAKKLPHSPGVYVNTGNPGPAGKNWPKSSATTPAKCVDPKSYSDVGCAYNYGWKSMQHAMDLAQKAGVSPNHTWWLDVETMNSWDGKTAGGVVGATNTADVQGAYDYLRSNGVKEVGIYSTAYQWSDITGGYHASTAATYRSAWAKAFKPKFAMESAPLWQAGVEKQGDRTGLEVARERCGVSFTGAPVRLAQFIVDGLDHNLVCGLPKPSDDPCRAGAPIPVGRTPVFGTASADKLKGTSKDEIFYGGPGNDTIDADGGADIVCGGSGADLLYGADGADVLYGGTGKDVLYGNSGSDRIYGGDSDDKIYGGTWSDKLYGQDGSDTIDGGSGDNHCSGGADKDKPLKNC